MKILYILVIIFLCALIGTATGELILLIVPETWKLYEILSATINPVWSVEQCDILILSFNLRISFNFNIMTLVGLITGCFFSLRKV